jgi:hypothetical protein
MTQDLRPGSAAIALSPEGLGIYAPATAMASILELTDPHAGEGHHPPTNYVPEPETFYLIRYCLNDRVVTESVPAAHLRAPKFYIGQTVFLDHNLDFWWDRKGRFCNQALNIGYAGPFKIVGIAYPEGSLKYLTAEAEYWIQIGTGSGGARRWWRERWLRGSWEEDNAAAERE